MEATMSQCDDLLRRISRCEHQLHLLEEQASAFNFHTPPHITLEIEGIEAELRALSARFAELDCQEDSAVRNE
jgi:hypothetical protein